MKLGDGGSFQSGTFVEPVSEAVEHNSLLPGGNQADRPALHRRSVVNVVFKDEDLERKRHRTEAASDTLGNTLHMNAR